MMNERIAGVILSAVAAEGARLSSLCDYKATFEGWWKAEIALALQKHFSGSNDFCACVESKPLWAKLCDPTRKDRFDLAVVPVNAMKQPDYGATPRVWLYLKERATWWDGGAKKALQEPKKSIDADLRKGREMNWTEDDFAAAVQITWCPDTEEVCELPSSWESVIAKLAAEYGRWGKPLRMCYPRGTGKFNLIACDIFNIHLSAFAQK